MSKTLTGILKKTQQRNRKYFDNYLKYGEEIKEKAQELLGSVRVLMFGSVVKGEARPTSDIDVLIISEALPQEASQKAKIRTKIKSEIDPFSPFQLHLVTPEEFNGWYKNFIDEFKEI